MYRHGHMDPLEWVHTHVWLLFKSLVYGILTRHPKVLDAKFCLTLCDPMGCSLPGSSVYGIFQARILEWVAIPFSK